MLVSSEAYGCNHYTLEVTTHEPKVIYHKISVFNTKKSVL